MEWAHWKNFYKQQPLWLVKRYFGDKVERSAVLCMMTLNTCHPQIGLYFAWLGFYNQMLVFPALFGLFVFLFGAVTVNSSSINYAG